MEENTRHALDRSDRLILDLLQREGALPVAEVAARTGLSTTTCWRRIQQLEQDGVIRGHALRRDGTIRDTVMYSMRAGEWPEARAQLLYLRGRHD